jgi:hypothetical protein
MQLQTELYDQSMSMESSVENVQSIKTKQI